MSTAILIHGCHLQADSWEDIVWGDPLSGRLGRVTKALKLARQMKTELLYWGTGASEKDGMKEAVYTFTHAVSRCGELPEYQGFDTYEIDSILRSRSYFDTEAQNTADEVRGAMRLCAERGIENLYLVSSPTHIARCMQEAQKIRATSNIGGVDVFAVSSDTCFKGSNPADVVVIEPPHRGDMPKWQTHRYATATFQIMRQGNNSFAAYLRRWGDLLAESGVDVTWQPVGN